jgi:Fur family transcriptional regulator, ferric uptake regulator
MPISIESASILRAKGFRLTPQRLTILEVLSESNCHLTPTEIFERASQTLPGLTEPTVYRTLSFLAENDLVLVAHIGNGQLVYEYANHKHHHLICHDCHQMLELDHAVLQDFYKRIERQTGFKIDSLHVTFFGRCPDCQGETTIKSINQGDSEP